MFAHEGFHLPIEHIVAADQAQIFEQLARKERHDGAEVGRPGAVELNRMVNLRVEHRLEDDLPGLLRRERFQRQPLVA